MKLGMAYLEKGNFAEALVEVDKSLQALLAGGNPLAIKSEANFCVAYKVALGLLIAIRDMEVRIAANPADTAQAHELNVKMGFLSKLLSDIPLKTNHRIVCVRMAISKNMHPQVGNYTVVARLVEALLLKGAPDREALQAKLKKCKEVGTDSSLPPYSCPHCSQACSSAALKCSTCGRPVRWCFKTFELIASTKEYLQCNFCNAIFSENVAKSQNLCDFCKYGSLEKKE